MPKVIDQAVKSQIIKLHLEGKGRNEISEMPGIKENVSSGTISNIISVFKSSNKSDSHLVKSPETQTQPRSEQVQLEELHRQKEQIENEIVILDAEKSWMEDRLDKGYRLIDTYKKIAADFSVVKKEMADAGMTFTDSILFKSIVGIFKKHNYSSAKIMQAFAELARFKEDQPDHPSENAAIEKLKGRVTEKYIELSQLEERITALKIQKEALLTEVEESRKAIDVEKKTAQEVKKYGIDSEKFLDTLHLFQRFNFDSNSMVNAFMEIQDVASEKRNIMRLKQEVSEQQRILNERLAGLGLGNIDELTQVIFNIMTLKNDYGIEIEKIAELLTTINTDQLKQLQWNGGQDYNQGYNYGYTSF